jgi:hypothetical protein
VWSTCMFCNGSLGRNEVVEAFPVGRRLAFDPAKGRLWVVCRRCERWNLTPLEERWEAIEACERLVRETRLRVSTDQIGLARLREGLELVRIGAPERPEFAAWRYGDQFGRRRKRAMIVGAGVASVLGVGAVAGLATGVVSGTLLAQSGNFYNLYQQYRTAARLRTPAGELLRVKGGHLERARFIRGEGEGFDLEVEHTRGTTRITGPDTPQVAGRLMAQVNRSGAKRGVVDEAVQRIEEARDPALYLTRTVEAHAAEPRFTSIGVLGKPLRKPRAVDIPGSLARLDHPTRLAVEMALHEEHERRALEGELFLLTQAWKEAEEVAAISDNLLLPEGVEERLEELRRGELSDPGPTIGKEETGS